MSDDRLDELLIGTSNWDRGSHRALFDELAPKMAAHLGASGVPQGPAQSAIVEVFANIWVHDGFAPIRPDQSIQDWFCDMAMAEVATRMPSSYPPVEITDEIWKKVAKRSYPESWRNILVRTDVLFAVIGAFVWGILLLIFSGRG
ncbi:hypothetical protein L0666_04975 [Octadecabacter sp. CECT 8868]|uniref:hypothetical protein n=1 Tax=Octadecabacter algicola TaxID=2909342 RepID=UPI001F1EF84D|nr:hypothetical protein [Octadecabacter algicola]MCF2904330.1 hypothetical protein [Octadecabacter algicola]